MFLSFKEEIPSNGNKVTILEKIVSILEKIVDKNSSRKRSVRGYQPTNTLDL